VTQDSQRGPSAAHPGGLTGGSAPAAGPAEAAREIVSAVRRGDRPGAEQVLGAYLAGAGRSAAGHEHGEAGPAATSIRELVLQLAEIAADSTP
jgi:hypothetical protein